MPNFTLQSILITIGLFLSSVGDYLLIDETNLVVGIGAFALAHLSFMGSYVSDVFSNNDKKKSTGLIYQITAFAIYVLAYRTFVVLNPFIPLDFKTPVVIYSIILSSMVALSLYRHNKTGMKAFFLTTFGAILFALSDTVLSFSLFMPGVKGVTIELTVMITYYLAELLIFNGAYAHFSEKIQFPQQKVEKQEKKQ